MSVDLKSSGFNANYFIPFLLQLAIPIFAVFVAWEFAQHTFLVPPQLRKQSPLDFADLTSFAVVFLISHSIILGSIRFFNNHHPFLDVRQLYIQGCGAMVATSLASSSIFLLSSTPFSANYFAWVFVIVAAAYLFLFIVFQCFGLADKKGSQTTASLTCAIFSSWTIVVFLFVASPAALAFLYKANQDFSNAVNAARSYFSPIHDSTWTLVDAFPGLYFEQPMMFVFEPGKPGTFLILSRTGRLRRYFIDVDKSPEMVLDISKEVGRLDLEMGAYSFVLHPDFGKPASRQKGYVYLYFTHVGEEGQYNRLVRYDISLPTQKDREASRLDLWNLGRKPTSMHQGGGMLFGDDRFLYISLGDFHMPFDTQQITNRLIGGIFRIDVDMIGGDVSGPIKRQPLDGATQNYFIPKDNPWYATKNALQEYWALGFRNPWRISKDKKSGMIWLSDVGRDAFEEHNRVESGDNGAWPYREGPALTEFRRPEVVIGREIEPVYHYAQSALERAAVGGIIYYGKKHPDLVGKYIFADNTAATLSALDPSNPTESARVITSANQYGQLGISSINTHDDGEVYVTLLGGENRSSGQIVKLARANGSTAKAVETSEGRSREQLGSVAARIERTYVSHCSRCHGADGRGAENMDLGVKRPDFTSEAWQKESSDEGIAKVITEGGRSVGKSSTMPAWGDFFTEEELETLVRKLRSFAD